MISDEYKSSFITYELQSGIYTFTDISEALFNLLSHEFPGPSNVVDIEFDDITMKTKSIVRNGILASKLDEKSFFNTILGFTAGWDYRLYNKYTSQKTVNLNTTKK